MWFDLLDHNLFISYYLILKKMKIKIIYFLKAFINKVKK